MEFEDLEKGGEVMVTVRTTRENSEEEVYFAG